MSFIVTPIAAEEGDKLEVLATAQDLPEAKRLLKELPAGKYNIWKLARKHCHVEEVPARRKVDLGEPTVTRESRERSHADG